MNKKMRELMASIEAKNAEAKGLMESDPEKASAVLDEIDALKAAFDLEKRVYENEKGLEGAEPKAVEPMQAGAAEMTEGDKFAKNIVNLAYNKDLVEGTPAAGGYTVPVDIQTKIEHWKELPDYSLLSEIDTVKVTTLSGERTFQKRGKPTVFTETAEGAAIDNKIAAPTFERVSYKCTKKTGYMPVTSELLADSTANIYGEMVTWLQRANIATANAQILAKIKTNEETDLGDLDGIVKAVIVDLEVFEGTIKMYTNASGMLYLAKLKDNDGRPLLTWDPTAPMKRVLACGPYSLPVEQIPSDLLTNGESNKVPFIIGSLRDGIRRYDRAQIVLKASDTGSIGEYNAFEQDVTLIRAIFRDDYEVLDKTAWVNGYITVGE